MYSSNKEDDKVEKRSRGWNLRALKGKKKDKDSPEFKRWFERHRASRSRTTRKKLEMLAKAPLQGRVYQPQPHSKYERRNKTTKTSDSKTDLGIEKNILGDFL